MSKQKKGVLYFTRKELMKIGPDDISAIDERETAAIEKASGVSFDDLKITRHYDVDKDRMVITWEVAG